MRLVGKGQTRGFLRLVLHREGNWWIVKNSAVLCATDATCEVLCKKQYVSYSVRLIGDLDKSISLISEQSWGGRQLARKLFSIFFFTLFFCDPFFWPDWWAEVRGRQLARKLFSGSARDDPTLLHPLQLFSVSPTTFMVMSSLMNWGAADDDNWVAFLWTGGQSLKLHQRCWQCKAWWSTMSCVREQLEKFTFIAAL